jgi:hypothetical protein
MAPSQTSPQSEEAHDSDKVTVTASAQAANARPLPEAQPAKGGQEVGAEQMEEEVGSEEEGVLSAQPGVQGLHASSGRWRLQVSVPYAAVQDLLPAAQLLSSANKPNVDYKAAKAVFLAALQHAADLQRAGAGADSAAPQQPLSAILAEDLRRQVCKVRGHYRGVDRPTIRC